MTPLPATLSGSGTGSGGLCAWRLERSTYADDWSLAEGAYRFGGRWSPPGVRVIYAALEPATAVLEVAVHKGFAALDAVPHELLQLRLEPDAAHVVQPSDIPNPHWLRPSIPTPQQQEFGWALLKQHGVLVLPSVVCGHAWNCLIDVRVLSAQALMLQERFALDPRLAAGVRAEPQALAAEGRKRRRVS